MIDGMLVLSMTLAAAALARHILSVHAENRGLKEARRRTAALMRRVRRQRDHAHRFIRVMNSSAKVKATLDRVYGERSPAKGWAN